MGEWNPKNIPFEIKGICECDDHDDDESPRFAKIRLVMDYVRVYDPYDNLYEKLEKYGDREADFIIETIEDNRWKPNSEQYWCEECYEHNTE